MDVLSAAARISQIAQTQTQPPPSNNPLINQSGQDIIYLGIGLMAIVVVLIIGLLSRKLEYAIVLSLILAAVIIFLVTLI